tara:strand:+ start:180 stop:311 length:132 start_codon:yes stop_codon:yes gene_type:complete
MKKLLGILVIGLCGRTRYQTGHSISGSVSIVDVKEFKLEVKFI